MDLHGVGAGGGGTVVGGMGGVEARMSLSDVKLVSDMARCVRACVRVFWPRISIVGVYCILSRGVYSFAGLCAVRLWCRHQEEIS